MMKNKRGVAPLAGLLLVSVIIIIAVAVLGLAGGIGGAIKLNSIIKSMPSWFWYILIGVLILWLIPKR